MDITPDSEETRQLLDQARAGDRQAFERLFAHCRPFLERVVALLRQAWTAAVHAPGS